MCCCSSDIPRNDDKYTTDLDNMVKFVLDALNGVAYLDDAQISVLSASKRYSEENSYINVQLCKLSTVVPLDNLML